MRPPAKRPRRAPSIPDDFASSSAAHIFAPTSTQSIPSTNALLHPCSFEISLNHHSDLKRSLHPPPSPSHASDGIQWGSRLVAWTSTSGNHTILTDRYDALHLLSDLPPKPPTSSNPAEEGDVGWSDLDSDSEDLFYMTPAEAVMFKHNKAKAKLEAQHSTRLAALSPSPPPDPEEPLGLGREQFELMQKTAKVLARSDNAAKLELKILANHGGDERFGFLRRGERGEWSDVWEVLQRRKGEMEYEEVLELMKAKTEERVGGGLVGYDSESEEDEPTASVVVEEVMDQQTEEDKEKKRKQAERLARAKEWLKSRPSKPPSAPQ